MPDGPGRMSECNEFSHTTKRWVESAVSTNQFGGNAVAQVLQNWIRVIAQIHWIARSITLAGCLAASPSDCGGQRTLPYRWGRDYIGMKRREILAQVAVGYDGHPHV